MTGGEGLELVHGQAEVADPPALAALDELVADLAHITDQRVRCRPRLVGRQAEPAGQLLDDPVAVVGDHREVHPHMQLRVAIAGALAHPSELLVGGLRCAVPERLAVDHAGGQVDVDPDDIRFAASQREDPATATADQDRRSTGA